ncbi:MAG: glucose-6-phosphate isomerase [Oscillospiraceae bacterium]|nr:glucose-6-phosphate isomerase [Oscillospiraceae bacterium]
MIKVDLSGAESFWGEAGPDYEKCAAAHRTLTERSGPGAEFTGWLELPERIASGELDRILSAAARIRARGDVLIVVGIGGSYLGARAAYDLLGRKGDGVELIFAGTGLSAVAVRDAIERLGDRDFCINVVSKSGTTLEPAVGFRIFKELLIRKYGPAGAAERIFATTDARRGALKSAADAAGWECFVVPDDVGGRYSVLSAVGLLPLAAAGQDVKAMLAAAGAAFKALDERSSANPAWQYAAARQALYRSGKTIEILGCYEPRFRMMAEWWKQLYGESEGKNGLGIFPASVEFNADLHSMGQYIQDGPRHLMETVVSFGESGAAYAIPADEADGDGLNYLAGHDLNEISAIARAAVKEAHIQGGVPNLAVEVSAMDEAGFAELVCFFEFACALSGYMQGVNPFDQPGVEAYKKLMFKGLEALK